MKKYRVYLEIEATEDSNDHDLEDWINDIWWDDAEVVHYTVSSKPLETIDPEKVFSGQK